MKLITLIKSECNRPILIYLLDKITIYKACYGCIYDNVRYCSHIFPGTFSGCLSHIPEEDIRYQIYETYKYSNYITFRDGLLYEDNLFIGLVLKRFIRSNKMHRILCRELLK